MRDDLVEMSGIEKTLGSVELLAVTSNFVFPATGNVAKPHVLASLRFYVLAETTKALGVYVCVCLQ